MKTTGRRLVLAAAALLLLGGGGAGAREVAREGFEKLSGESLVGVVPGRDGIGWTQQATAFDLASPPLVDLPVRFGASPRGLISFDLKRKDVALEKGRRTVFELLDDRGASLLLAQWEWSSAAAGLRPVLHLVGTEYLQNGLGLWGLGVPLDREVAPGEWVHVDLRWDDPARSYSVFVDGRVQDLGPGAALDYRPEANRYNEVGGLPPLYRSRPFGSLLEKAATIRLGAHTNPERPGTGSSPLAHAVLDNFVVVSDEPLEELHAAKHDVKDLKGVFTPGGVELTWAPPEIHGVDQQYFVYRRAGAEGTGRFEKLTAEPVRDLRFVDTSAVAGQTYRYSLTSVYGDLQGGLLEGKYPPEVTVTAAGLSVDSIAAERALYGAGQEIVVTLRGTKDVVASFALEGVAAGAAMEEVDDGVYVGRVQVPEGLTAAAAALTGTVTEPDTGKRAVKAGRAVGIDTAAPEPVARVVGEAPWHAEVRVSWIPSASADAAEYRVYRGEGAEPVASGKPYAAVRGTDFVDTRVIPGLEYRYCVVSADGAGNASAPSDTVSARAVAGEGPKISGFSVTPAKPLRPGDIAAVAVVGESGGTVSVDLGELALGLVLTEEGRTGRYVGSYQVCEKDVAATRTLHRAVVRLTDALGSSVFAGPEVAVIGRDGLADTEPPVLASVSHDARSVAGTSGKLVAGDVVTLRAEGEAGGYGSFAVEGTDIQGKLSEASPGVYTGSFVVPAGTQGEGAACRLRLADEAGNQTEVVAEQKLSFDTRVRLLVTSDEPMLPADGQAQARLTAKAVDANGGAVEQHELALTLSTTEDYTGVVGGGSLEGREAREEDEDDLEVRWDGTTDAFGAVEATYTAGRAAKTALIVAKDLTTGDVGAGWLNTYVASTVAIELIPRSRKGTPDRAALRLTAEPAKLTADGRSTSRVRAWLVGMDGKPLPGCAVAFALGNGNGRLKVLEGSTDARGLAEAEYRAGTAIGTVTITASAAAYGVTGSVQITLMSDAPADVQLVASAKKLYADGESEANLSVRVTDVHGNPNHEVPVTLAVLKGEGRLSATSKLTDRNGEFTAVFTAGTREGMAVVEARHTSRPPTEAELRRVYGTVFVPRLSERQERDRVTLVEWLVDAGDEVEAGQPLAVLDTRTGPRSLAAPAKGVFVRPVKHERDRVELGETLGYLEIDPEVWANEYGR